MQSPQPRNPAEELITVVSDLQSRLSALEDENRQLKGAGGGANLTLARCARRLLAMNRKFCPRERSVGKLSVYGLAFLFVIIR